MIYLHYILSYNSPSKHTLSNFSLVFMTEIYECQADALCLDKGYIVSV